MVNENKEPIANFVGVKKLVKVRHLTGPNAGFERTVKEPIAKIWETRGQVKILGPAKAAESAHRLDKIKELVKVAAELGIKKPDKLKEAELVEAIEAARADAR